MPKFLLLIIALAVAFVWLSRSARSSRASLHRTPPAVPLPENTAVCAHCGVYQPVSECVESSGRYFCCEDHRRAFALGGSGERS